MTGKQLGLRMGLSQARITELETAERHGQITMRSLERAAEALGCRLAYTLVPVRPLTKTIEEQAQRAAEQRLIHVMQTMSLEDQAVGGKTQQEHMKRELIEGLLKVRGRIWAIDDHA